MNLAQRTQLGQLFSSVLPTRDNPVVFNPVFTIDFNHRGLEFDSWNISVYVKGGAPFVIPDAPIGIKSDVVKQKIKRYFIQLRFESTLRAALIMLAPGLLLLLAGFITKWIITGFLADRQIN